MTHDEVRSLLDAYIDDELELATGAAVEAHLQGCAECTAWLAERRALVGQLHVAALRYPVPGDLSARIGATLRSQDRRLRIQPQWFGAIAAGLIVAIGGRMESAISHSATSNAHQEFLLVGGSSTQSNVRTITAATPANVTSSTYSLVMGLSQS